MSALQFQKVKHSAFADTCCAEGCNRSGRYAVYVIGMPLPSFSPLAFHPTGRMCLKHRREWTKTWDEFSGAKELGEVEAAIGELTQPLPVRTKAVFALRELGLSKDEVVRAMKLAGDRVPVEQILEELCGGEADLEIAA